MPHAGTNADPDAIRDAWIIRLNELFGNIETWAQSFDWTTRRLDKSMKDPEIGPYRAPGLILQKEFTRILIDPISRTTTGSDGLVDIYVMPALDDIASLYFYDGRWNVHYRVPNDEAAATIPDAPARPLTRETLAEVLEGMVQHAA